MLLGTLYTINSLESKENNTVLAKIEINKDHEIFEGHFPNHPVMPGVCLTNIITDTLSSFLTTDYYLFTADFIKFIQLVLPEKTNTVLATLKILSQEEDIIKAEATISDENTTYL